MPNENDYIELRFVTGNDSQKKDILVAQLTELGFDGFEEEATLLKAFIGARQFEDATVRSLAESHGLGYTTSVIGYKNWNEVWESGFEPVIIENFCAIRAGFHQPVTDVKFEIIITPKMSFGTGHHATTYLMIDAMKDIVFEGRSVFDFGTGTGVLAILAEKMGASFIEAIDIDDWSIENGHENLAQNKSEKIFLYKSGEINSAKNYDIILANINRNVILEQLGVMQSRLSPKGIIVLSGLLTGDEEAVTRAAILVHLKLYAKKERNSWICLQFVNA